MEYTESDRESQARCRLWQARGVDVVRPSSWNSMRRSCLIRSALVALAEASDAKQTENIGYLG